MMDVVSELCYSFAEDVSKRTKQIDIQYLLGLTGAIITFLKIILMSSTVPET